MMLGSGRPARPGGVVITISPTSATWAGITFIRTEEGYPAVPPGTYTPGPVQPPHPLAGDNAVCQGVDAALLLLPLVEGPDVLRRLFQRG